MLDEEQVSDRNMLYAFVADADVACPNCEYNLRNLREDRCPECGLDLELRVNLVEPRVARLVLAMIGLALSVGFSGFPLAVIFFAIAFSGGSDFPPIEFIVIPLCFFTVSILMVFVTWYFRSWLRRLSTRMANLVILVCWLTPVLNATGVFILLI